jgi:hypothetical protein
MNAFAVNHRAEELEMQERQNEMNQMVNSGKEIDKKYYNEHTAFMDRYKASHPEMLAIPSEEPKEGEPAEYNKYSAFTYAKQKAGMSGGSEE